MKALAKLSGRARLIFVVALFAVISGPPVYRTIYYRTAYPEFSLSPQQYADLTQHPYASVLGAAFPGVLAALVAYGILAWLAKKNDTKISN